MIKGTALPSNQYVVSYHKGDTLGTLMTKREAWEFYKAQGNKLGLKITHVLNLIGTQVWPKPLSQTLQGLMDILTDNKGYRGGSDRLYNFDHKCFCIYNQTPLLAQELILEISKTSDTEWVASTGAHPDTKSLTIVYLSGHTRR